MTVVPNPFEIACDFDGDRVCGVGDIDLLMNAGSVDQGVPVEAGNEVFDLNGGGLINQKDVLYWLSIAATESGFRESYRLGDANLDGVVNVLDLNAVALAWETDGNTWTTGDFNGDGLVDPHDLNQVARAWLSSIPSIAPRAATVPEPTMNGVYLLAMLMFTLLSRSRS